MSLTVKEIDEIANRPWTPVEETIQVHCLRSLAEIANRPWAPVEEGCSDLQVMESVAGYYVGRHKMIDGYPMPYSRESGYFATQERANLALEFLLEMEKGE